jgi:hypothetical protein
MAMRKTNTCKPTVRASSKQLCTLRSQRSRDCSQWLPHAWPRHGSTHPRCPSPPNRCWGRSSGNAAAERVESLGGKVLLPVSREVREGTKVVVEDPSGAILNMTGRLTMRNFMRIIGLTALLAATVSLGGCTGTVGVGLSVGVPIGSHGYMSVGGSLWYSPDRRTGTPVSAQPEHRPRRTAPEP